MSDPIIGNRIIVEVQSELGNPLTISSITLANPPVVTYTPDSTGALANGDIVVFNITSGMDDMHRQACRVASATGTTFQAEGLDSSDYDAFVAGTVTKVETFGAFDKSRTVSAPNADPPQVDVTTLKDKRSRVVYGLPGAITGDITALFNPGGETEALLEDASDHQTPVVIRIRYADGRSTVVNTLVAFGSGFSLAPNAAAESSVKFTPQGAKGLVHYGT